ncbi:MAG TPA: DUF885 domain-containing protein [Sphingomonas sp.]|nr:DUF885 domain-containing protein [Sphingomonas sp.]
MGRTRREAMAVLAGGIAFGAGGARLAAQTPAPGAPPPCPGLAAVEATDAPILGLLPEAAVRAGLPEAANGGAAAARCDDCSPDGAAALALAVEAARGAIPATGCGEGALQVRALLDAAHATADQRYGRNDPLAAIHRPYLVSAYAGPHLDTPTAMRLWQRVDTPAALDAWAAKLEAWGEALLGAAERVRADNGNGCAPPVATGRAALVQMDAFLELPATEAHPMATAMAARAAAAGLDPTRIGAARRQAAGGIADHVLPAMAILRDTLATATRSGRAEPGVWAQPQGEALHAANLARAGDMSMSPAEAQALGRAEAERVAGLLDHRLAARGLKNGSLAERIAAAFSAHPEFIVSDDETGHAALLAAAQNSLDAAHGVLPRLVEKPAADPQPLDLKPLPSGGKETAAGSFYLPAAIDGGRPAALWLDNRSAYALPLPGVPPIAFHLGLPGLHLQASTARIASTARPMLARIAAWPAATEGWGCYAERLAAEQHLFAHDPWADIARLSDELLRAARLVVDVGIHQQRWNYAQAEAEMTAMTGAPQRPAIDRIAAMPGEAASATLGLHRLLDLRDRAKAKAGKHFALAAFHQAVLADGPRPFAQIEAAVLG